MCGNCKDCKGGVCAEGGCKSCGKCVPAMVAKILVIVGGINWGLIGLGTLINGSDWNVVKMALGGMPKLEAAVYVLVGLAAIMKIFGCKCKKCMGGACAMDDKMGAKEEKKM